MLRFKKRFLKKTKRIQILSESTTLTISCLKSTTRPTFIGVVPQRHSKILKISSSVPLPNLGWAFFHLTQPIVKQFLQRPTLASTPLHLCAHGHLVRQTFFTRQWQPPVTIATVITFLKVFVHSGKTTFTAQNAEVGFKINENNQTRHMSVLPTNLRIQIKLEWRIAPQFQIFQLVQIQPLLLPFARTVTLTEEWTTIFRLTTSYKLPT